MDVHSNSRDFFLRQSSLKIFAFSSITFRGERMSQIFWSPLRTIFSMPSPISAGKQSFFLGLHLALFSQFTLFFFFCRVAFEKSQKPMYEFLLSGFGNMADSKYIDQVFTLF